MIRQLELFGSGQPWGLREQYNHEIWIAVTGLRWLQREAEFDNAEYRATLRHIIQGDPHG